MRFFPAALFMLLLLAAPCLGDATTQPVAGGAGGAVGRDEHAGQLILPAGESVPTTQSSGVPRGGIELDSGQVVLALGAVIGLIFLLRHFSRKLFPAAIAARGQTVRVLARCPLAPRQQVLLIQVGKRIVVAADCASHLTSLCQITDADEVASLLGEIQRDKQSPIATPFTAWFSRAAEAFGNEEGREEGNATEVEAPAAEVADDSTRQEIRSLTAKVRDLARQFGGPAANG